jgi:hypothetical protein
MVKTDDQKKEQSPMTARLFLNSIKTWHPDGVHVVVESISKAQETDREDRVAFAFNLGICEDMPKCRARVIGDDGRVVKVIDDMGDEKDKIEIIENPEEVTIWLNMNVEDPETEEYKVYTMGSAFPLINYAFIKSGDISENNKKNLIFTYDEMLDVLEGLEFKAQTETRKFKGGKPYQVLIPRDL